MKKTLGINKYQKQEKRFENAKKSMLNLLNKKENEDQYLENLRKKVLKEIGEINEPEKSKTNENLLVSNKKDLTEIKILKNKFSIIPQDDEFRFYLGNSTCYVISDKPSIRILYRKFYIHVEKHKNMYYVVTNQDIQLNHEVCGLFKEKDAISFYIKNLAGFNVEENKITLKSEEKKLNEGEIEDNNTLVISQKDGKVYLPFKGEEIIQEAENLGNLTPEELIEKKYILPITNFTNSIKARFSEAYKLMRYKENKSFRESVLLGIELMFEFHLHPAIIAACRNMEELDIYLDCLDDNELDKFTCFQIVYKALPKVVKHKGKQITE